MRVPLEVEKQIEQQRIAAYVVGHLPIVKSYAIKIGLVDIINELFPSKMRRFNKTVVQPAPSLRVRQKLWTACLFR